MAKLIHRIVAWKTRKDFGNTDKKRDKGQTVPGDIIRFENLVYGPDTKFPKWQLLDLYRPAAKEKTEKLPVIVSVHGGAWVYGPSPTPAVHSDSPPSSQ